MDFAFGTLALLRLCMLSLASRPLGVSPAGESDKRAKSSKEGCLFLINKTIMKDEWGWGIVEDGKDGGGRRERAACVAGKKSVGAPSI